MPDQSENLDVMFYQLILSMQASAMQHLGKIMSPITSKIERNLEAAKYSIDLLEVIQRKTEGNLSAEEKKLLDHILYELRMNYVDEVNKPADEGTTGEENGSEKAENESTTTDSSEEKTADESKREDGADSEETRTSE